MAKYLLAFSLLVLASITVNAQSQRTKSKQLIGQAFDEIVVSSDLNVQRKSKENRHGKSLLLTNEPSGKTSRGKPSSLASRLILSDGTSVAVERRKKRAANKANTRILEKARFPHWD